MAYKPDSTTSQVRDVTYPNEIAAQRPLCAPRIHCEPTLEERVEAATESIRGSQAEDRSAEFNRRLREG